MEEVLISHPSVAECAVIGAFDPLTHQVPLGLIVLSNACEKTHQQVEEEVISLFILNPCILTNSYYR